MEDWEFLLDLLSAHAPELAESFWDASLARYLNDERTHRLAAAVQRRLGNRTKAAAHYTLAVAGQPGLADAEFEKWLLGCQAPPSAEAPRRESADWLPRPLPPTRPLAKTPGLALLTETRLLSKPLLPKAGRDQAKAKNKRGIVSLPAKPALPSKKAVAFRPSSGPVIQSNRDLRKKAWLPVVATAALHLLLLGAGVFWVVTAVERPSKPPDFLPAASAGEKTTVKAQKSELKRQGLLKNSPANVASLQRIASVNAASIVLPEREASDLPALDFPAPSAGFSSGIGAGGGDGGVGKGGRGGGFNGGPGMAAAFVARPPLFQLFGVEIKARKLGVVLDVSSSMYAALPQVIEEVNRSFPDAALVITRGCGLDNSKRREEGETAAQRLNREEFKKDDIFKELSARPEGKELLATLRQRRNVWFVPARNRFHTIHAFDQLLKEKVDAVYWFADFQDELAVETVDELAADLAGKKVLLYAQSASKAKRSTSNIALVGERLAKATGGSVIPVDAKPNAGAALAPGQVQPTDVSRALQPRL